MAKFILILIIGLIFEATGVVFLSGGLKQIGEAKQINFSEIVGLIKRGAANSNILLGVLFEAIFFGILLYLLSQKDVTLIWPLTALGFVITAFVAKIYLGEEVSPTRWAGIVLIVAGASLITYSEKIREQKAAEAARAISTNPGLR